MEHDIKARDLRFALPPDLPRYWHGGRRSLTIYMNNLSVFFPQGERFFISSVKAHSKYAEGPLREAVAAFCQQEGYHSREHTRYNEMLAAQGYPVAAMEAGIGRLLGWARRTPRRRQLAITCALEHFTAILAHSFLKDPRILAGADAQMASLWRWHAAEEIEHKAVAMDLYRAAGGGYLLRVLPMIVTTVIFLAKILEQQVRMMATDRLLFSGREWFALFAFLFVRPGGMLGVMWQYLHYFRPGFHPFDLDNSALIAAWQKEAA